MFRKNKKKDPLVTSQGAQPIFFIRKFFGQNYRQNIGIISVVLWKYFLATHGLVYGI
jgi:hypothetical protein